VDTTFVINTSVPLTFKEEGLYYMTEDTTETSGIGLVVTNKRFPKMTRPAELAKPVMYMSQNQEITELLAAKDPKKSLDRYWLTLMSGNTDLAKRTISVFYNRVEEANRLFTSYKEGWKTDKGMIFIIMGPPDRVQRSKDREVWVFSQRANFSEINFTFNRRPNQFVDDYYELQRYVEYQPIWYPMVEAWRTGAVRE
jgi:GWxTD domain-containing protein